jgi:hypothetical protein
MVLENKLEPVTVFATDFHADALAVTFLRVLLPRNIYNVRPRGDVATRDRTAQLRSAFLDYHKIRINTHSSSFHTRRGREQFLSLAYRKPEQIATVSLLL